MKHEKTLEVQIVAKRLQVHPTTVRRMFHRGLLDGYLTGPSKTRIRVYESSVENHINKQYEQ